MSAKRTPKPVDFVPEETFPEGHKWAGAFRCTAWNPNQGRQCGALAIKTSRTHKCRVHGGKTPKGPASPNYKHGRYSVIPRDLIGNFEDALQDTALFSLTREVALIESMMADVLKKWEAQAGGGGAKAWGDVAEALEFVFVSMNEGDADGVAAGLSTIREIVDGSTKAAEYAEEFLRLADKKKELVRAEAARMRDTAETMTRGMVILYFDRMFREIAARSGQIIDGDFLIELSDTFERILIGARSVNSIPSGG